MWCVSGSSGQELGLWLGSPAHSGSIKTDRSMLSLSGPRYITFAPHSGDACDPPAPCLLAAVSGLLGGGGKTHLLCDPSAVSTRLFPDMAVKGDLQGPGGPSKPWTTKSRCTSFCPFWFPGQERGRAKSSRLGRSLEFQCVSLASLTACYLC